MLNGDNRFWGIRRWVVESEKQRVLMVTDDRYDANRLHDIRRNIDVDILVLRLRPVAAAWVNIEAEDGLVGPPL